MSVTISIGICAIVRSQITNLFIGLDMVYHKGEHRTTRAVGSSRVVLIHILLAICPEALLIGTVKRWSSFGGGVE